MKRLLGKTLPFYGIDGNKFKLGPKVYIALEDPSDGYRSYLESVEQVDQDPKDIFFHRAVATVRVEEDSSVDGYQLVDITDGHVWLRIGTCDYDDWYPYFVFDYFPKERA